MLTAIAPEAEIPSVAVLTVPASVHRIILTGFMGAGKSTTGRALASRLGWTFLDVDALIEDTHACTIASLFENHGEDAFRRLESQAISRALGRRNTVIALGGGAPEILTNRLLLEQTPHSVTVFLDAPFGELFDRCMLQPGAAIRPVLADPAAAEARFARRQPLYRRIAHLTVNTSGKTLNSTVDDVLTGLHTIRA